MKHILLVYDNSRLANKTFALALELAFFYKAEISILSIVQPLEIP